MGSLGGRRERGRVLLTLVDRRTKLDAEGRDLYERLVAAVDARGWPRFTAYLSRSPRVEALNSGSSRPRSILHEGKGTLVQKQLRELAEEVGKLLGLEGDRAVREAGGPRSESLQPSQGGLAPRSGTPPPRDFAADLRSALFRGLRGR